MKDTVYIYTLENSQTNEIKYVGKCENLSIRLRKHLTDKSKTKKTIWIKSLESPPLISILDEVPENEWKFWETFWISIFKSWGFILANGTSGGEGGNTFQNRRHTEKTKLKISQSLKGRKIINNSRKGPKNGRFQDFKLPKDQMILFIKDIEKHISQRKLSRKYNINRNTVCKYQKRKNELKRYIAGWTGDGSSSVS